MSWMAASASSGKFAPVETASTQDELLTVLDDLSSRPEGYVEIRNTDQEYPLISIGFRAGHAVIHRAEESGSMSLLHGDGSVLSEVMIEVPIIDDPAEFTGEFVLAVERAWRLMREFARTGEVSDFGDWYGL